VIGHCRIGEEKLFIGNNLLYGHLHGGEYIEAAVRSRHSYDYMLRLFVRGGVKSYKPYTA